MFNRLRSRRARPVADEPMVEASYATAAIESVRDHWQALYAEQTATLEALTVIGEELQHIADASRHLMAILGSRTASGVAAFKLNDDATAHDIELLRHAVLDLQAKLEGSLLPPLVLSDRVVH